LQFFFLEALRYGFGGVPHMVLQVMPISETLHMILPEANSFSQFSLVYFFLVTVFLVTALALMPLGQLCGALMSRMEPLKAYGMNLLGSLAGVVLTFALSYFWTPPTVWFSVGVAVLLLFLVHRTPSLIFSSLSAILALAVLAWPNTFLSEDCYSPYQLIQRQCSLHGWMKLSAQGTYFQRVFDLSPDAQRAWPMLHHQASYYGLPYLAHPVLDRVAIVGAGSGNDAAAALRAGAKEVDAVEIDPAVVAFGKAYHPEDPYNNPRVHLILNDARAFLRGTKNQYDMIIFGVLDSHTLTSHASALRLDSYVYTIQSLKEARNHLKPGGVISLAFDSHWPEMMLKIYKMMTEACDGHPPIVFTDGYATTFMQSKEGDLTTPQSVSSNAILKDLTPEILALDKTTHVDVSTDDWPFFYMLRRVFPFSYILMLAIIAIVSGALIFSFHSPKVPASTLPFMFLGAGFMLVETKSITELGLCFGNTWYVVGIVIASIMLMAFFANTLVSKLKLRNALIPYLLLMLSLGGGLALANSGWLPSSDLEKLELTAVLTMPIFFSGMVFSILFAEVTDISSAMAMNLLGAMLGGLLEYNAMYFGYRSLYVMALVIYGISFLCLRPKSKAQVAGSQTGLGDSAGGGAAPGAGVPSS
ncbi:MAG TPA: hypothetical protein V6C72_12925, partial [Chroococcales cyanobacterium]